MQMKSQAGLVGIVIPTFRPSQHLVELLDTIQAQDDQSWEVLIVDDSGNGSVKRIVHQQLPIDKFSWLVNSSNLGLPNSWNLGLATLLNRNRYAAVSVVHDDDLVHPDYVKTIRQLLSLYPEMSIYHFRTRVIRANGRRAVSIPDLAKSFFNPFLWGRDYVSRGDKGLARVLNSNFVFCPSMVFNLSQLRRIEFDPQWKFVTDLSLVADELLGGHAILRSKRPLYIYRRHKENVTSRLTATTDRFSEEIALYKQLERKCSALGFDLSARAARARRSIRFHILYQFAIGVISRDWGRVTRLRDHWRAC